MLLFLFVEFYLLFSLVLAVGGVSAGRMSAAEHSSTDIKRETGQNDTAEVEVSSIDKRNTPQQGQFKIYVRYARNLPDTDGWLAGDPDPYVKITAVKENGASYPKQTGYIRGTRNPTWNTMLDWQAHGCNDWHHYEVEVFDDDPGSDDLMFPKGQFDITPGTRYYQRHSYLTYDQILLPDGNDCSPNPCQNGGRCFDGCNKYTCHCTNSYGGTNCEHLIGQLLIYARSGTGLQDRDGFLAGDSDPYMQVFAEDHNGNTLLLRTHDDRGDQSPEWYVNLNFGTRMWKKFTVRVYDEDTWSDDALSNSQVIPLPSTSISVTNVVHNAYEGGRAYLDYTFG